ncbi:MAG: dephospho-CoA kinase [Spirochaetaceae bacterium]|nr:MAG: dephospho-CoA kinase [Spirochaetaceae bacterium]
MVIGVTGKYCSGKNFITSILEAREFAIADVDTIGHEVLDEKREETAKLFGIDVLLPNGHINRKMLGEIVFANRAKLKQLEDLLHPAMKERVASFVKKHANSAINAALLYTMGLDMLCDAVITVQAPLLQRIFRGMKRDHLSLFQVIRRILAQRKIQVKNTEGEADRYIISNSGDEAEMVIDATKSIASIIESLKQRKREP